MLLLYEGGELIGKGESGGSVGIKVYKVVRKRC